jgi:UDP-N-acetylglucosamine 2-epimerase (non-hydrolysing)
LKIKVVFPVNPRTRQRIEEFGFDAGKRHMSGPVPYVEFLALQRRAAVVIIDSGGIQEETTYFGVPCLNLRNNSERPVTVTLVTTVVVGQGRDKPSSELSRILSGRAKKGIIPPLWDGDAGERIADVIQTIQ